MPRIIHFCDARARSYLYILALLFITIASARADSEPDTHLQFLQAIDNAVGKKDIAFLKVAMRKGVQGDVNWCGLGMAKAGFSPEEQAPVWRECLLNEEFWRERDGVYQIEMRQMNAEMLLCHVLTKLFQQPMKFEHVLTRRERFALVRRLDTEVLATLRR